MRSIGLIPSDTGQLDGKETGQKMTHYIAPDGVFARACVTFLETNSPVLYHDRIGEGEEATRKKKAASKTKYTCLDCGLNAWAKPKVSLICGASEQEMEAKEPEETEPAKVRKATAPEAQSQPRPSAYRGAQLTL